MKIAGIIAEYNPFHEGHAYQIEETKRRFGADAVCVIMSPSWVQRGEPAVFERYARVKMALAGGADVVIEMPTPFATAAAPDFAYWGTTVLSALGCDALSFGCENEDAFLLRKTAEIIAKEPDPFSMVLKDSLKIGLSYPAAREAALNSILAEKHLNRMTPELLHDLLSKSNNILALEYCASIVRENLPIRIAPIRRIGSEYNETNLPSAKNPNVVKTYPSAMAIRKELEKHPHADAAELITVVEDLVPDLIAELISKETPLFPNEFSILLQYAIIGKSRKELEEIADVGEDIAGRIMDIPTDFRTWNDWADALKVRQFTYTRICRALTHILLGIRSEEVSHWKSSPDAKYARILGFRKESSSVIREFKDRSSIPILTKPADSDKLLSPDALSLFEKTVSCEHIYQTVLMTKRTFHKGQLTMTAVGKPADLSNLISSNLARHIHSEPIPSFRNEYRTGPVIL